MDYSFEDIHEVMDAEKFRPEDNVAVEDDDAGTAEKARAREVRAARIAWEESPEGIEWRKAERALLDKELAKCIVS